jgi:glucose/arabinose dehydrogenase/type 1 glutamine amidotransferase/PKD repeat protein
VRNRCHVIAVCLSLVLGIVAVPAAAAQPRFSVLVFSKVNGFHHDSIPAGRQAIAELGAEHGFGVTVSDDASLFTDAGLAPFDAVVFNNTNGRDGAILDAGQRAAFERYVRAGGGYAGVHSASGTEYDWAWYGRLVGAFFDKHPAVQPVRIQVDDRAHPSTRDVPQDWRRTEEPYDFRANPRGSVHVLASYDTRSYTGHTMGPDHPVSWCQDFEGGRSWYTGLGHDPAAYAEPAFRAHLLGGIQWAAGAVPGDCGATEDDRYRKTLLEGDTDDPLALEVDNSGRVFYIQRGGRLNVYDPKAGHSHEAGRFDAFVLHTHGMHGLVLDPDFEDNGYLYVYYSPRTKTVNRLSRVRFDEFTNTIDMASEKVLLEFFSQREINAHEGGGMAFDRDGNLYLSTGDNVDPCCEGFAPIDERAGRRNQDAQGTSANTNDLRGKILRVHPEADGTYTIPEGNLFPPGTEKTRPEIWVMGLRNPYRVHLDPETGWVYWGEVGPDAQNDNPARGPMGYDEFNVAKEAGNFGWPLCIGANRPSVEYDFTTGTSGQAYDCAGGPVNDSPNNTGLAKLPPARPAWLAYPYRVSDEWPELGTGGRLAVGGPTYHYDADLESETKFPAYHDDTTFVADWTRNAMFEVKSDREGNAFSVNGFLPRAGFLRPIDMEFGPDGSLYVIEWGTNYGGSGRGDPNWDSGIHRVDYLRPGERAPVAKATATPSSGKAPLTVRFTDRSTDPDTGQALTHEWDFDGDGTIDSTAADPTHTFTGNGTHLARLVVTDPTGRRTPVTVKVTVGNTAPRVAIRSPANGEVFDWGVPVPYALAVTDPDGAVDCEEPLTRGGVGHARQVHPVDQSRGCAGELVPRPVEGHAAKDDLTYVLDASYTDTGRPRLTARDRVTLQPRRKEAEHYDGAGGVRVVNNSEGGGAGLVSGVSHGDWFSVSPVNLKGVANLRFRVASSANGGTIEVRQGNPDGPLLGSAAVPVTGGGQAWTEVTAAVTDPGTTFEIVVVARNPGATGDLFNVDWFEFGPEAR